MFEKVENVLRVYGLLLPAPVRGVVVELAREFDRLRAEVEQLRSNQSKGE